MQRPPNTRSITPPCRRPSASGRSCCSAWR